MTPSMNPASRRPATELNSQFRSLGAFHEWLDSEEAHAWVEWAFGRWDELTSAEQAHFDGWVGPFILAALAEEIDTPAEDATRSATEAERDRYREALKQARDALHRACLRIGSTEGFGKDFLVINQALSDGDD